VTDLFTKRFGRLCLVAAALALSGCSSLNAINPFREREVPLAGARKPVFPPGHPSAGPQRATLPTNHSSQPQPAAVAAAPAQPSAATAGQ